MIVQCDTREHKKEWERIRSQFDSLGVEYIRSKLWVGDYMNIDNPRLVIDRKKDLLELCGNITQQHERFKAELVRAQEKGIKIIILCENGEGIENLSDVYFWHNPRLDITDWVVIDGKPMKKPKYPRATTGRALYASMITMREKYGVEFVFCDKEDTGYVITKILGEQHER
jgi:ERCC4-type nuclease